MTDLTTPELLLQLSLRFLPVWACMAVILTGSIATRRKTGLYGQIFDSPIGVAGFSLVLFWVLTALFANQIITHDPYGQFSGMKNALPAAPFPGRMKIPIFGICWAATIWPAMFSHGWFPAAGSF